MTGFEPRISGIVSDHSTNCVTTTALFCSTVSSLYAALPASASKLQIKIFGQKIFS